MKCIECAETVEFRWVEEVNEDLRRRQMCFLDAFWAKQLEQPGGVVTESFSHYRIGAEDARGFRGFDGRRFFVEFFDGSEVETTNLWGQATVPERWRDRFVPNAKVESEWGRREAERRTAVDPGKLQ